MSTFIAVQTHKMPPADYHTCPDWSVSQTKLLPDSPEEFYGLHVAEPPRWAKGPTPAMNFGSMVHSRLLEPGTFAELYPQAEQCSGVLKSGKGAGERCSHQGSFRLPDGTWLCGVHTKGESSARLVNCITSEDVARLNSIVRNCEESADVRSLLGVKGEIEYSLFGTHQPTGLLVRGRLDKWYTHGEARVILDVKTTSPDPFNERLMAAHFYGLGYHRQAAWYLDLMEGAGSPCEAFVFLAIKTVIPFTCAVWTLNPNAIELGRRQNELALADLALRFKSGDWSNEKAALQPLMLDVPPYAYDSNTFPAAPFLEEFADYAE